MDIVDLMHSHCLQSHHHVLLALNDIECLLLLHRMVNPHEAFDLIQESKSVQVEEDQMLIMLVFSHSLDN